MEVKQKKNNLIANIVTILLYLLESDWVTPRGIQEKTGVSPSSVYRTINTLKSMGLLQIKGNIEKGRVQGHRIFLYRLKDSLRVGVIKSSEVIVNG